jgi:hypothetical protein
MSDCFAELRKIDADCSLARTNTELQATLDCFVDLEKRINHLWIPSVARDAFYNLKNAVEITRLKTERIKRHLETPTSQAIKGAH